jgi:DNA polymerase IV
MRRTILHIDMNSYFASVEQMCNPFLRGKPIAVGGAPGTRTIVIAASREAKRYGVSLGMLHHEALACCPDLLFIEGDPAKYTDLTQTFIDICKRYTDRLEVYSVDELFLDLTSWIKSKEDALRIARYLKEDLRREVGDYLTCSVGIAPNRMLAKLGSDMQKPDGLVVIDDQAIPAILEWVEMVDMPGIGPRLKIRLGDLGIRTLKQLGGYPLASLQQLFGPVNGQRLSDIGRGIDHAPVPYVDDIAPTKSMGHTYTLSADTRSKDEIYGHLLRLAEKVGRRLRRDSYEGRRVWVYLRWDDFTGRHEAVTLPRYIDDGYEIYRCGRQIMDQWYLVKPVRLVGIGATMLKQSGKQLTVLPDEHKREGLVKAQDVINDRYGEQTIQRARTLNVRLRTKVGGFKTPHQFH